MLRPLTPDVVDPPLAADVDVPLTSEAAALARRTVVDLLRGWRLGDEDFLSAALLVTSVLVGDAVRHGRSSGDSGPPARPGPLDPDRQ